MTGVVVTLLIAGFLFVYVSLRAFDEDRLWEAGGAYVMAMACWFIAGMAVLST